MNHVVSLLGWDTDLPTTVLLLEDVFDGLYFKIQHLLILTFRYPIPEVIHMLRFVATAHFCDITLYLWKETKLHCFFHDHLHSMAVHLH